MQMRVNFFAAGVLAALAPVYGQKVIDPAVSAKLELEKLSARRAIVGRPFSATEERHSLQILADGTRIETRQINRLYRDSDGRTRIEEQGGIVQILDPRTGLSAALDPAAKVILNKKLATTLLPDQQEADLKMTALLTRRLLSDGETLVPQMIGGALARGARSTTTIPIGVIGNDRPITIVTERWYSDELQIMVKSTNSDPRFGDTTYQVTDIVQGPQDPALFQIPGDYGSAGNKAVLDKFAAADEAKRKAAELKKQKEAVNEHE